MVYTGSLVLQTTSLVFQDQKVDSDLRLVSLALGWGEELAAPFGELVFGQTYSLWLRLITLLNIDNISLLLSFGFIAGRSLQAWMLCC